MEGEHATSPDRDVPEPLAGAGAAVLTGESLGCKMLEPGPTGGRRMERSSEVADAVIRFYEAFLSGTTEAFDSVVSQDPDALAIGTEPWLRFDDRDAWHAGFVGLGSVTLERGQIRGFRHGSVGWIIDDPTYVDPDGRRLRLRLTAVALEEGDGWKLGHVHISVGVPDEVALAKAAGWEAAAPA